MTGAEAMRGVGILGLGLVIGWWAKPAPETAESEASMRVARERGVRENDAEQRQLRRWMDRLETERVAEVMDSVPTEDLEGLIGGVMSSAWGALSREELARLGALISEWAERDPEGALAWGRSLRHPRQREVALVYVAATVGSEDPLAGFEIYAELEGVGMEFGTGVLSEMMTKAYAIAAEEGIEALLDLSARLPVSTTRRVMGISVQYPEDTDFAALLDGLSAVTSLGGDSAKSKAFSITDPMAAWAQREPEAAFAHAVDRAGEGQRVRWGRAGYELGRQWGTVEADRWVGARLAELSSAEQQAMFRRSDLASNPGLLRRYLANMPDEESAAAIRHELLQYSVESKNGRLSLEVLNDVPELSDRVAAVERLRGVADPERIEAILETISRDEEGGGEEPVRAK